MISTALARWYAYTKAHDPALLDMQLADDAVFISPVVHTPQRGKPVTKAYLMAAFEVLGKSEFRYQREYRNATGAVLEFTAVVDGITLNGIDMIEWNMDGKITEFKVMVRPLKAVNLLHQKMADMLGKMKG
jgi:hypothetical protein